MAMKEELKVFAEKMDKSIKSVGSEFGAVRAGRASATVLDRITVDYYGAQLLISPWDASALKGIEKAIQESDLGINPQNDGRAIRLTFPQLTEERRKELVKQIHKYSEAGKVAVRNIRREAMDAIKKMEKDSLITEDDRKDLEKDLQKLTDDKIKEIDVLLAAKEKELMAV